MQAFILAGGFATRLWPLTEKRAKPLLPLAGKPLIDHLLEKIPPEMPVTVSTNAAFAESFRRWREQGQRENVRIVVEQTKGESEKLGALGAVAQWVKAEGVGDDLLLLTGDNYCGFSLQDFLAARPPATPLIAAYDIRDRAKASPFGTIVPAKDGMHVDAFEEKPREPKSSLVATGVSVIPASLLPVLVEFAAKKPDNVGGVFEEFLRRGIHTAFRAFTDPWFDIGSFATYLEATETLVGKNVLLGQEASMENSKTEGSVVLGAGSRVQGSSLKNVILFENCRIENCMLEDCILDDRCVLEGIDLKGQMLREGTVLRRTWDRGLRT